MWSNHYNLKKGTQHVLQQMCGVAFKLFVVPEGPVSALLIQHGKSVLVSMPKELAHNGAFKPEAMGTRKTSCLRTASSC